jgi:hypothetical protein
MPGAHNNRGTYRDQTIPRGTHLSIAQRVEILTLYHRARWSKRKIGRELQIAQSTVRKVISSGIVTPTKPIGRAPLLTTGKRCRLVARATQDAFHRRLTFEEVAHIEGISVCRRSLTKAFEKEQYHRRKATEKPLLTPDHLTRRVTWANIHKAWEFDMWKRVDWTDESTFRIGGFGDVWVTRKAEEKYDLSCCTPKFRHRPGLMVAGAISGISKGPLHIFEVGESVTADVYAYKVLPKFYHHIREMEREIGFMRGILIEDNASPHAATFRRGWHAYYEINRMIWPANSPDLNPIENVWRLLKYRIGKRFPKTIDELRQYLIEEWDRLTIDDYIKYIEEMPNRCKAVIDNNGGHTKW